MVAFSHTSEYQAEQVLARLADSALALILESGVESPSINVELDLWHALTATYHNERRATPISDHLLTKLVDTAYQVALHHGARGSFLDLELGLWHAFERVCRSREPLTRRDLRLAPRAQAVQPQTLLTAR